MWLVMVLFAIGILFLGFGQSAAADRPSNAEMESWQSGPGVAESTEDPRFRVPLPTATTAKPVKEREFVFEIDEEEAEEIKRRQLPVSDHGARVIQIPLQTLRTQSPAVAPPLGTNFTGFSLGSSGYIPPDPVMAAGPNHLILAVNLVWGIWSKSGSPGFITPISSWFASVNTLNLNYSDPKVIYDQYAGRWIVMCMGFGSAANPRGAYFLSVSDDSDPNGTWFKWMVAVPSDGTFPDFPSVGYDASEAIYFTGNHFHNVDFSFRYAGIVILKKSELYANNPAVPPLTVTRFNAMRDPADGGLTFTIKPALSFGPPVSGMFFVNTQGSIGSYIELWRINNPVTAPALVHRATIPIGSYSAPPNAAQPNNVTPIETNNSSLQSEVQYRNGSLFFAFPQAANFDTVTVSAIRYLQIDTSGAIAQNILYGAGGEYFFFPAPLSDNSGNVAMVFSHSSPGSFCAARYVGNFPDDMAAGILRTGEATYALVGGGQNRWGDYAGISQDPVFPRKIWMYQEFARATTPSFPNGNWGTWCGAIELPNHAPQIDAPPLLTLNEGTVLLDTITVSEPDGENLSSFSLLPSGPGYVSFTNLGGGKGELRLAAGCFDAGTDTIRLVAVDNASSALSDTALIEINVLEANCAPSALFSGPDTIRINQCQTRSFLITAFDPDSSGGVSFSAAQPPVLAAVSDSGGGRASLHLAPTTADLGEYAVQVFASDGQDSSVLTLPVQVFQKGDLNQDGALAPADIVLVLNCIFLNVPAPAGLDACDLDGNGPSASDVVVMINAAFLEDSLPPC